MQVVVRRLYVFFFFQAEDGIRDLYVTGVQTCALPIYCACARKGHPGHGPQYLWNVSVGGKTQARNLPLGPELEKVQQEVERYQSFVRLSQELIAVNDQICQLRPARTIKDENELEQLKKKLRRNFVEKRKRK